MRGRGHFFPCPDVALIRLVRCVCFSCPVFYFVMKNYCFKPNDTCTNITLCAFAHIYIYIYCVVLWKRHAAGPQENHWQHIILTRKYNANWTFSARQFKQHWKKRTSRHAECALSRQNHKHFPQCARALCVF